MVLKFFIKVREKSWNFVRLIAWEPCIYHKMMSRKNAQVIQHRYKTTGSLIEFQDAIATTISTVGFHSGRCLGAHLQMCELKLSLGLVVRIFVHLSSNSEMNMFICNYILHIIYQAATYFTILSKFKVPKWR